MKTALALSLLTVSLAANAQAASSKVCFGSTKSDDTRGVVMLALIDANKISLKTVSQTQFEYKGTFPSYNRTAQGRDGKTYLTYKGMNTDYQDVIMVDQELLKSATTGLLQIRARGEGFFNSVFMCKDARP